MQIKWFALFGLLGLLLITCTPKVAEEVSEVVETAPVKEEPQDENLSPCPKFSDAPDPDQAEEDYVLYRDNLKFNRLDVAFDYWQKVYKVAPAADGKRNTVYSDGIYFYEFFLSQTTDSVQKAAYIDAIFDLYDQIATCYPEATGYVNARKGFDYYYKYDDRKTKEEIYTYFKKAIDQDGLKVNDFAINPFTALLVELHQAKKIDDAEAKKYESLIREIIANGVADCKGTYCERWEIIEEYSLERLRAFEAVKDFYDCEYYKDQYFPIFESAQTDCDTILLVYSRLKWGGCANDDPKLAQVIEAGNKNCAVDDGPSTVQEAYSALRNAEYDTAVEKFKQAIAETDDTEKKGTYLLLISKVYYAHLRNFSQARNWALQAAEARPDWGEPFILIGKLYASSGPLCGSGRGWNSQVVTWVAIDMWNRAKRIDSSVAGEANKNIRRYTQYMPSKEDIFQRGLKEGGSYFVPCWIQASTTIRSAPD